MMEKPKNHSPAVCGQCGCEIPLRAVICPECGMILPRPGEKETPAEQTAPQSPDVPEKPAEPEVQDTVQSPFERVRAEQIRRTRLIRRLTALGILLVLVLAAAVYGIFFSGYKSAVHAYVRGVDSSSGAAYLSLAPDAYMDYLESTYSVTRRSVKSMIHDYFVYADKQNETAQKGRYRVTHVSAPLDQNEEMAQSLHTAYGIEVQVSQVREITLSIDDSGRKSTRVLHMVKIGHRWCCMETMSEIDYVVQNDGYNVW